MPRKYWLAAIICLLLLVASSYGGRRLYEHHLSSDLRQTLVAAADPSASLDDVQAYVRDGRLQVRTERDRAELAKLVKLVQLQEDSEQLFVNLKGDIAGGPCPQLEQLEQLEQLDSSEVTSSYGRNLATECKDNMRLLEEEQKQVNNDTKEFNRLFGELRADLGLPPLKGK